MIKHIFKYPIIVSGMLSIILFWLIVGAQDIESKSIHGKYTQNIDDYHLAIPHKATIEGEFSTFHLQHFHEYNPSLFKKRKKRELSDPDMVHYGILLNNQLYHVELWPNRNFLHPHLVIEKRDPTLPLYKRDTKGLGDQKMCYYRGKVRGLEDSSAAISTCDGLAGILRIGNKIYQIEPVDDHAPNEKGHHLHVVYEKNPESGSNFCGVDTSTENWEKSIRERLRQDYSKNKMLFKKEIGQEKHNYTVGGKHGEVREYEVVPMWIQMLIVGDNKFIKRHKGKRDITQWILTLMNTVKEYYSDETMPGVIEPVVSRIILLEKEEKEIDLSITADVLQTLDNFCDWTKKLQAPNDSAYHFDTAILLSDWDFCHAGNSCSVQGIALLGSGCGKAPCMLIEDKGFMAGLTISHEQGHLIGIAHDSGPPFCPPNDPVDSTGYVMNPMSLFLTAKWSPCSMTTIKEMAGSHFMDCYTNEPPESDYVIPDGMSGITSTILEQCRMELPDRNIQSTCGDTCSPIACFDGKVCRKVKPTQAADGTPCGENKWCFRKECVEKGARPSAVDGGWGEWTQWSKCTRTCGKGVQRRERFCNNPKPANHGKYCLGKRNDFKICMESNCPDDEPSFRGKQCIEKYNATLLKKSFSVKDYQYPVIIENEPCRIFCAFKNDKESESFHVADALDGTICTPGSPNIICVNMKCTEVGCDGRIESSAIEDQCGICNGDGTMCNMVEGVWTSPSKVEFYPKIVEIPAGARKIEVREVTSSPNIIAVGAADNSSFYLNGNFKIGPPGTNAIGKRKNMWLYYTGHSAPEEKLTIDRATEDLVVHLGMIKGSLTNYTWKWTEPADAPTYDPKYAWDTDEFEPCSAECDGGTQLPKFHCTEEKRGKVSNKYCDNIEKPTIEPQKCNEKPCLIEWRVGKWGRCRACKKKGGVRVRSIECVKKNPKPGADGIIQEESKCEGPKPGSAELCETNKKCGTRRKRAYHIPGKYQQTVWQQMKKLHLVKRAAKSPVESFETFATVKRTFAHTKPTSEFSSTTHHIETAFTGKIPMPENTKLMIDDGVPRNVVEQEIKYETVGNLTDEDEKMGIRPGTRMVVGTTKIISDVIEKETTQKLKQFNNKKTNRSEMIECIPQTTKQTMIQCIPQTTRQNIIDDKSLR